MLSGNEKEQFNRNGIGYSEWSIIRPGYMPVSYTHLQYGEFSAPASTAFLLLIPFGLGIIICLVLAHFFSKKKAK